MKLAFKYSLDEPLEIILGAIRYEKFWQTNENKIKQAFLRHTGLEFQQDEIIVIAHNDHSWSGDHQKPMRLACWLEEDWRLGGELLHELAHRLLSTRNWTETEGMPEENYEAHKQIDLFLYDVFVDVLGREGADKKLAIECGHEEHKRAWDWALSKSYSERQQLLKEMIQRVE